MYPTTTIQALDASVIHLSERDVLPLRAVVHRYAGGRDAAAAEQLEAELERAVVLPPEAVPPDLVTMHARVVFADQTGKRREVELVYPWEADPSRGRISVLAPVGAALLGLSVGQTIDWPLPSGRNTEITIVAVAPDAGLEARP
jgi:regulator of nucleoside diphosphate kinase